MDTGIDQMYIEPAVGVSRVTPTAYTVVIFFFMSLAIVAAIARTTMRMTKFHRIDYDDMLLILSTMFLIAASAIQYEVRDLSYYQMSVSLGFFREPPPDFPQQMLRYMTLDNIASVTTWGAIFSVKFAFVVFFKKLVQRITNLERWWWFVLACLCVAMPVNMFAGFIICADFSSNLIQTCTIAGMTYREGIYQYLSATLDVVTDLLVVSIPIALLWHVKISLKQKFALGTVCSLSSVMIVIAILRVADSRLQSPVSAEIPPITDSSWLFVLQVVEAAVAIIMVSITAFRSMLGQDRNRSDYKHHSDMENSLGDSDLSRAKKRKSLAQSFGIGGGGGGGAESFGMQSPGSGGNYKPLAIPMNAARAKAPGRASFSPGVQSRRTEQDAWEALHSKKASEADSDWSTVVSPIHEQASSPLVSKFSRR